jgi:hypothetical protein
VIVTQGRLVAYLHLGRREYAVFEQDGEVRLGQARYLWIRARRCFLMADTQRSSRRGSVSH